MKGALTCIRTSMMLISLSAHWVNSLVAAGSSSADGNHARLWPELKNQQGLQRGCFEQGFWRLFLNRLTKPSRPTDPGQNSTTKLTYALPGRTFPWLPTGLVIVPYALPKWRKCEGICIARSHRRLTRNQRNVEVSMTKQALQALLTCASQSRMRGCPIIGSHLQTWTSCR